MKANNDHNRSEANELNSNLDINLDDNLASHVAALKKQQLSEDDYQQMESNLQRMISAQGHRGKSSIDIADRNNLTTKTKFADQLIAIFSPALSWQSLRLAGSMGAVVAVVLTLMFMGATSKTAFAIVLTEMRQVSSMFYSSQIKNNGQHLMDVKVYHRKPGQLRVETLPHGVAKEGAFINVINLVEGKGVIFFPSVKIATPFDSGTGYKFSSPEEDPLYWYEQLKNYQGEPDEYLAVKEVNGVLAEGFTIRKSGVNTTVWADTSNHLPVKLVVVFDEVNGQIPFELVADLKYNQIFDDALFSLVISPLYEISAED